MPSGNVPVNARLSLSMVSSLSDVLRREWEAAQRVPVQGSADDRVRIRYYLKNIQTKLNKLDKPSKLNNGYSWAIRRMKVLNLIH
jgi:hypothetical protein